MISNIQDLDPSLMKVSDSVQISEEIYEHFLNVLPPVRMGADYFVSQEGSGSAYHFSKSCNCYYVRLISADIYTKNYEVCLYFRKNMGDTNFIVKDVIFMDHCSLDETKRNLLKSYKDSVFLAPSDLFSEINKEIGLEF